ncbi:hypothetical protein F751_5028 [Auxenochlorella protothecoides]|uniref:Uncharacterized protein n=1 Tax=Auxenochlorella protothecoides TaxID=3075 RepID=A0A087SEN2_AUXPR|nr:hypothetical protein F751_5028 [Auxenochlorella protothecoides]KFM24186.1 hypothetical protein F751_5028 [Auxenochlorella protothecoides]
MSIKSLHYEVKMDVGRRDASLAKTAIEALLGPLEQSVTSASSACWQLAEVPVQVKGSLFGTKTLQVQQAHFQEEKEREGLAAALAAWQREALGPGLCGALDLAVAQERLLHVVARSLDAAEDGSLDARLAALGALLSAHPAAARIPPALRFLQHAAWRVAAAEPRLPQASLLRTLGSHPGACDAWAAHLLTLAAGEGAGPGVNSGPLLSVLRSLPDACALPASLLESVVQGTDWAALDDTTLARLAGLLAERAPCAGDEGAAQAAGIAAVLGALSRAGRVARSQAARGAVWGAVATVILAYARGRPATSLQASLGAPAPEEAPLIDLLGDEDELPRDRPPEGPVAGAELVALAAEALGGAPARRDPDHWQRALSGLALSVADLAPRLLLRVMLVLAVAAGGSGAAVTDAAETLLGVLGDAWIAADLSAEEAEDAGLLASLEAPPLTPEVAAGWAYVQLALLAAGSSPVPQEPMDVMETAAALAARATGGQEVSPDLLPCIAALLAGVATDGAGHRAVDPGAVGTLGTLAQAAFYAGLLDPAGGSAQSQGEALSPAKGHLESLGAARRAALAERLLRVGGWPAALAAWVESGRADAAGGDALEPRALEADFPGADAVGPNAPLNIDHVSLLRRAALDAGLRPAGLALWAQLAVRLATEGSNVGEASPQECLRQLALLSQEYHETCPAVPPFLSRLARALEGAGAEGQRGAPRAPDAQAAISQLAPDAALLAQLAEVDAGWQQALALARRPYDEPNPGPGVATSTNGDDENDVVALPTTAWAPGAGALRDLDAAMAGQAARLEEGGELLEYWARRGGKRSMHAPAGASSREGDVPEVVSQAQALLWEVTQRTEDELNSLATQLRTAVASRYRPLTLDRVAGAGGDHAPRPAPSQPPPAFEESKRFQEHYDGLRRSALQTLLHVLRDKSMVEAAQGIFLLERALLHGAAPRQPEAAGSSLSSQLAAVLATAALDGSTPPPAAPLFARLLDRALADGRAYFSLDQKAALVARVAVRTRDPGGAGSFGPPPNALLRALLDPGPSLAAGRLRDFGVMLDAVLSLPASAPERVALLREFDLGQYALACLQAGEGGGHASQAGPDLTALLSLALRLLRDGAAASVDAGCAGLLTRRVLGEGLRLLGEAAREEGLAPAELPQGLVRLLVHAPAALDAAWRSIGGEHPDTDAPEDELDSTRGQDADCVTARLGAGDAAGWARAEEGSADAGTPRAAGGSGAGGDRAAPAPQAALLLLMPVEPCTVGQLARAHAAAVSGLIAASVTGVAGPAAELEALAALLLDPIAASPAPPRALEWAWGLYRSDLRAALEACRAIDPGAAYTLLARWRALPWHTADFQLRPGSDCAETCLRALGAHLLSPDGGAAEALVAGLDFQPLLERAGTCPGQAAELALLALRTSLLLPDGDLPVWVVELLMPEEGPGDENVVPGCAASSPSCALQRLLQRADWGLVSAAARASSAVPWLALPMALAPSGVHGDAAAVASRVVRAAGVLGAAAAAAGHLAAAGAAAAMLAPLFGFSLAQGRLWAASADGPAAQASKGASPRVDLPPDIPLELLEGTEEGRALAEQQGRVAGGEGIVVEVTATWRLDCASLAGPILQALLHAASPAEAELGRSLEDNAKPGANLVSDLLSALAESPATVLTQEALACGTRGMLPWDEASALFIAANDVNVEADNETACALTDALCAATAAYAVPRAPELARVLLRGSLLASHLHRTAAVPRLWEALLELMVAGEACAEAGRPLAVAFLVEQLRRATLAVDKWPWQELVAEVTRAVVQLDPGSSPRGPLQVVPAWLALLSWVGDSRWRRLPAGPHTAAVQEWTEALSLRVLALQISDLEPGAAGSLQRPASPSMLDVALRRLKGFQTQIQLQGLGRRDAGAAARKEGGGLLDRVKDILRPSEGRDGDHKGMGTRLPQTYLPTADPDDPAPPSPEPGPAPAAPNKLPKVWAKGLSAVRSKILPSSRGDSPAKGQPPGRGGGPSVDQGPHNALSGHPRSASALEQGDWVRLGLAAFAIAAYVRSVLCPSLVTPPRVGPADMSPATPLGQAQHSHARSISMGSWRWDEHLLRELDTVLEARGELDVLEQLRGCPALVQHGEEFHAFFALVPELLSASTGVPAFQLRLQQLLLPGSEVLHLLQTC